MSTYPNSTTSMVSTTWSLDPQDIYAFRTSFRSVATQITVSILLALLVWRIWKFTVLPMIYPELPREFPYWIPCE